MRLRSQFIHKQINRLRGIDGGVSFTKVGWPNNQIIQAAGPNTTATAARGDQVGEGDHSVVQFGQWLYLFSLQWDDAPGHPTGVGLARTAVAEGGVPGTWKKFLCGPDNSCGFTAPGIGGNSSMLGNISGSTVTWRNISADNVSGDARFVIEFISIGTRGPWHDPEMTGHGPRLAFAQPPAMEPPLTWVQAEEPLVFADDESWARTNASAELYAYPSVVVDPSDGVLWFYYTYLLPGGTFSQRYFVRRRIDVAPRGAHDMGFRGSRVVLTMFQGGPRAGGRDADWWASTAVMPPSANYSRVAVVGTMLVTGGVGRTKLIDCYIDAWGDHMVSREAECTVTGTRSLRTLGFVLDADGAAAAKAAGLTTVLLYRCFDNNTKNHAVSLTADCAGKGVTEFALGHMISTAL